MPLKIIKRANQKIIKKEDDTTKLKNEIVDPKVKEEQQKNEKERRINPNNYEYNSKYWKKKLKPRLKISEDEVRAFENYIYSGENESVACEYARNIKFFYGNCDKDNEKGAQEIGFGCAWRSLQTLFTTCCSVNYAFRTLYRAYKEGDKSQSWEENKECAEPGYAKRMCEDFDFQYSLYRYNREGTEKTPTDQCVLIKDFSDLTVTLVDHFKKYKTPIMIDDVKHACVILGIKITKQDTVILWMADPYAQKRDEGLYYLILNGETGEVIAREGQKIELPEMNPEDGWLLLCLHEKIDHTDLFESKGERKLFAYDGNLPEQYGENELKAIKPQLEISQKYVDDFLEYGEKNGSSCIKNCLDTSKMYYAENIKFFYGLCDSYEGHLNWACAWRDIQTILSCYKIFSPLKNLCDAYRNTNERTEWAEPGYGFKILHDHQIKSKLYRYNNPKPSNKTLTHWCRPLKGFPALVSVLMKHFEKYKTPVMIDDVVYAYNIVGIKKIKKEKDNEIVFWIADPHKTSVQDGLYYLMLNEKTGKTIECTGIDNGHNGLDSSQRIDFANTGWLILCPQEQKKLELDMCC